MDEKPIVAPAEDADDTEAKEEARRRFIQALREGVESLRVGRVVTSRELKPILDELLKNDTAERRPPGC